MVKLVNNSKKKLKVVKATVAATARQPAPLTPEAKAQAHADLVVAIVTGIWELARWAYGLVTTDIAKKVANEIERSKKW